MKKSSAVRNLMKALGRDPQLKQVIAKARRQTRGKGRATVENVTGLFLLMLEIVARFSKKKRARALEDLMDTIYLLVQASLLLKENIFDRPEVKEFFSKRSKQVYLFAQECVDMVLPKGKAHIRPGMSERATSP